MPTIWTPIMLKKSNEMKSTSEIIFLRHAKTKPIESGQRDYERSLRKRAQKDLALISQEFQKRVEGNSAHVLCSSSQRTRQTLTLLESMDTVLPEQVLYDRALYLASAREIEKIFIKFWRQHKPDRLFVIGHNPGLTDLTSWIPDLRLDHLPTSGLVCLTHPKDAEDWNWELTQTKFALFPKLFKS